MNGSHAQSHQHPMHRNGRVVAHRPQRIAPKVDNPARAIGIAASALAVVLSAPIVLTITPLFVITGGAAMAFVGLALSVNRGLMIDRRSTSSRSKAHSAAAAYARYQSEKGPSSTPPLMITATSSSWPIAVELAESNADDPEADVIDLSKMFVERAQADEAVAA